MRNPNNPQHKLSDKDLKEARNLYENEGWKCRWISAKFRVHHTSILSRAKSLGWIRKVKILDKRPDEVVKIYKSYKVFPPQQRYKTFEEYVDSGYEDIKNLRQSKCPHNHLTVRCAVCGKVQGSEINFKEVIILPKG